MLLAFRIASLMIQPASAEDLADVWFGGETDDKRIALTFDDGPHYRHTAEILDILAEYDIPATFFIVGSLAERQPELVLRELDEGHEVASHTWSHPHIKNVTEDSLAKELTATEDFLQELANYRPALFRPPEGACGDPVRRVAAKLGYDVVLWTVDTRDWAHTPADQIAQNVMQNTREGSIILCHDFVAGDSPTIAALKVFIPVLLADGFEFVTVSELIAQE